MRRRSSPRCEPAGATSRTALYCDRDLARGDVVTLELVTDDAHGLRVFATRFEAFDTLGRHGSSEEAGDDVEAILLEDVQVFRGASLALQRDRLHEVALGIEHVIRAQGSFGVVAIARRGHDPDRAVVTNGEVRNILRHFVDVGFATRN